MKLMHAHTSIFLIKKVNKITTINNKYSFIQKKLHQETENEHQLKHIQAYLLAITHFQTILDKVSILSQKLKFAQVSSLHRLAIIITMSVRLFAFSDDANCPQSPVVRPLRLNIKEFNVLGEDRMLLADRSGSRNMNSSTSTRKLQKKKRIMSFLREKQMHEDNSS